jgi:hypothetical protein
MPLLEEHVRHVPIATIDDETLNLTDVGIGRVDVLTPTHGHLPRREYVARDGLRDVPDAESHIATDNAAAETVDRPGERLAGAIVGVSEAAREELRLLRDLELLEVADRAAQPHFVGGRVDKVERNESAESSAMLGFDHEVRD